MIEPGQILPLVPEHLAVQRWFDGDAAPEQVEIVAAEPWLDGDPALWWLLVDAHGPSGVARYQLVVGARSEPERHDFLNGKDTELLGQVQTDSGPFAVYDATIDSALAIHLLSRVAPDVSASTVRPLTVEMSNSSIVYDEHVIVKLFRRIHDGPNPDVEAVQRLHELDFTHVPAQYGALRHDDADLAVARQFLTGASDGWLLALTSLRVLFADHERAAASGGDFGPDAFRLGAITAELHLRLAEAYGTSTADASAWVAGFRAQLDRVRDHVPAEAISLRYDRIAQLGGEADALGPAIRIHGDLHLGQTLRADAGWFVIDFEGEPARPLGERILPSSPLRDVAGMLRSFHYAAEVGRWERNGDHDEVGRVVDDWERRVRDEYLAGYLATDGIGDLLPSEDVSRRLLEAFELDKAVYEVAYEVAYRPTWVGIPLGAIQRLLG